MSESDLILSHPDPALKQHRKKKRRRDDGDNEHVDEAKAEKKRRKKHHEDLESGATVLPVVESGIDVEGPSIETEKKKKKKEKRHREHVEDNDGTEVEADQGTEKRKEKRKRDSADAAGSTNEGSEPKGDAPRERKKKKDKHAVEGIPDAPAVSLEALDTDPPVRKKKKRSKEQEVSSSSAPTPDTMFPVPANLLVHPPAPSAEPDMALFPTHPFPDLAFASNEDVLRALQDLDLSKIAGVLKTLTDAADAANIALPIASTSAVLPPAPVAGSGTSGKTKKHRRKLVDLMAPSSSSEPASHSGHAHLLANKWMGANKLAELVASEGLVYKKGKFSAIEIKQVNEAMQNYCTTRGLSEEDLNQIIFPSDEKKKDAVFWSEITSAVPLRPIVAVYQYVRRAHHPMKQQGKWQPEEDAKLIQAVTSLGQQWEKVAQLVGRMATDCRDRYRNHIVDREKRVNGAWSTAEEEELTRIVTTMQQGKNLDTDIFWGKVSEMMDGKRSRQQCRIKWTDSLSKKFKTDGATARWGTHDAFILVHKIDALGVRDDTEIDWKSIPDSQWNLFSAHTVQRRWLTMKKSIKGFEDMTHSEIMDILRVKYAEMPSYAKVSKVAKVPARSDEYIEDSDNDEPQAGSSTGPGTLVAEGGPDDDSE